MSFKIVKPDICIHSGNIKGHIYDRNIVDINIAFTVRQRYSDAYTAWNTKCNNCEMLVEEDEG